MQKEKKFLISALKQAEAESQIVDHHNVIDYDTREYPVEVLVQKYLNRLKEDDNDLFVPDYQRELTWPDDHQSRFIESVLMGLPIPYLFVADVQGKEGRIEIVDGSQRIRTLARFMSNELKLSGLKKLDKLNNFRYKDLPPIRQRRFGRHTLRMIELRENANEDVRRDIFNRINTGSQKLSDMEVRWGASDGPFLEFIRSCSEQLIQSNLAPLSEKAIRRREAQEFVLRFFTYLRDYTNFNRSVVEFLNNYLKDMEVFNDQDRANAQEEWERMLEFVKKNFKNGFSKGKGHIRTPRIRFEALSVGSALALRSNPNLAPTSVSWLESDDFKSHMRSDASNSRPKVVSRIEYVRDHLLEGSV